MNDRFYFATNILMQNIIHFVDVLGGEQEMNGWMVVVVHVVTAKPAAAFESYDLIFDPNDSSEKVNPMNINTIQMSKVVYLVFYSV